jgi:hypothetical protein
VFPNPVPATADLSGQLTQYAPRWSAALIASYSKLLPGSYKFTTQVRPYYSSSYNDTDPYVPALGNYVRLDAGLSLENPGGHWGIDLIGKNLTDRVIFASSSVITARKEQPRNVAVQFRYHY